MAYSEMQSELPLWSSGLESLGYSDPFPKFSHRSPSSYDQMEEDEDFAVRPGFELDGTEEEKGWKFYIGSICNRRTTNDIVSDMWRQGEKGWTKDIPDLLRKTMDAERVVTSWYEPRAPSHEVPQTQFKCPQLALLTLFPKVRNLASGDPVCKRQSRPEVLLPRSVPHGTGEDLPTSILPCNAFPGYANFHQKEQSIVGRSVSLGAKGH